MVQHLAALVVRSPSADRFRQFLFFLDVCWTTQSHFCFSMFFSLPKSTRGAKELVMVVSGASGLSHCKLVHRFPHYWNRNVPRILYKNPSTTMYQLYDRCIIYIYRCTYIHIHTYIYTYTYIHIHIYIYTYTYIHIYIYIYTYIYTCVSYNWNLNMLTPHKTATTDY